MCEHDYECCVVCFLHCSHLIICNFPPDPQVKGENAGKATEEPKIETCIQNLENVIVVRHRRDRFCCFFLVKKQTVQRMPSGETYWPRGRLLR